MDLSGLLALIEGMPAFARLREGLKGGGDGEVAALEAAKPYVIAALYRGLRKPMLVLSARPEDAKRLYEQISAWLGDGRVRYFPEPDALPYERIAPDATTEMERIQVLSALVNCSREAIPPLIVTSAPALMGKTASHTDFASTCHSVSAGLDIEPFDLLRKWEAMGYRTESMVEVPGTMSHRGGIIDIYPPTSEQPARLEFFGNTVESLRLFDPVSQRSVKEVSSISISPATEFLAPLLKDRATLERVIRQLDLSRCTAEVCGQFKEALDGLLAGQRPREVEFYGSLFSTDSILDYLPAGAIVVLDEPSNLEQSVGQLAAEAELLRADFETRGELAGNFPRPYFEWPELAARMKSRQRLRLTAFGENPLEFSSASSFGGQVPKFIETVKELKDGKRLIIISPQANRLSELFEEADILATPQSGIKQPPASGSITLLQGSLAEGWMLQNETHLFTDAEIFGFVKQRRLVKKRPVAHHKLFVDLIPGEFVVHVEHGIAKFIGVSTLTGANGSKEYLLLQYGSGDKLYVPTDQIDRVNRYVGASDRPPVLSRLGTMEWNRTKQRAKEAAEALAKELLALYATREVVPGYAFSRDSVWQQELEGSFPYVETPDQMQAQTDVKADMEKPKPMDRLVCGDVGYGKTEVAIRAAFKAVMDGKQAAVLVPTTVLAEQHYITFSQRMKAFPMKIEVLSRFKSAREQRAILEGVANGSVDICIGTHRLLQKDVKFKDLGLLIIDEEQRFGVAHKEHFKKVRQEVDVLSLSATPIPRTLHMSLVGVRDMSTMETPPEERLPIKTYVAEYNDRIVREAILREIERNGQAFFVHNRVQSIGWMAMQLQALVPEARVSVGHGQMDENELESVMTEFAQGKSDVLVCSTIIESGLDMPNVNTLIINQADKLGLSQLYQLRGRVGRGANLAYAYFLYDRGKRLTPTAEKRLRTIYEATELGAGFTIAMKDLEIRGAGTLLGTKQSGYISAIGFDLYTRLLSEAVEEQKARMAGKPAPKHRLPEPTIDLPQTAYIPEAYVPDVNTRLELYRTLVKQAEAGKIDGAEQEFRDRFGQLPPEVENLLYAVRIKGLAGKAGIESISTEANQIIIRRFQEMPVDRQRLASFADKVRFGHTQIIMDYKRLPNWQKVLEEMIKRMG